MRLRRFCVAAMGGFCVAAGTAWGFELGANQDKTDGQALDGVNPVESIADTGGAGLLLYDWIGGASAGLNMAGFRIKANAYSLALTLDLRNTGAVSGGGALQTGSAAGNSGNISIQNATAVAAGDVNTRPISSGSYGGGSVTITNVNGNIIIGKIDTGAYRSATGGTVVVFSSGAITVGDVTTGDQTSDSYSTAAGSFTATHTGALTGGAFTMLSTRDAASGSGTALFDGGNSSGAFNVGYVDAHRQAFNAALIAGSVTIRNYTNVDLGKDGTNCSIRTDCVANSGAGRGGAITVGPGITGYIKMTGGFRTGGNKDGAPGAVSLTCTNYIQIGGDIVTGDQTSSSYSSASANITASHNGAFTAGGIQMWATRDGSSGAASFDGRDKSGAFQIDWLDGYRMNLGNTAIRDGISVIIRNYASVTIGKRTADGCSLKTGGDNGGLGSKGGPVAITNISGNIAIAGTISLNSDENDAYDGDLTLTTSGGGISLASLDMSLVRTATLDFATTCVVTGAVSNLATNYTGGAGQPLDPYVTTQTKLRAAFGKKIMYHPEVSGNAYLGGASWRVADLAGAAGQGGVLTPYQARGTVVIMK